MFRVVFFLSFNIRTCEVISGSVSSFLAAPRSPLSWRIRTPSGSLWFPSGDPIGEERRSSRLVHRSGEQKHTHTHTNTMKYEAYMFQRVRGIPPFFERHPGSVLFVWNLF